MDHLVTTLFLLLTLVLFAGSVGLWTRLLRRFAHGEPLVPARFRDPRVAVPRLALALTLAWLGLAFFTSGAPEGSATFDLHRVRQAVIGTLVGDLIVVAVVLLSLLLTARSWVDLVKLGFRTDHLGKQLQDGAWGFLAAVLPVSLVLVASSPLRNEESTHPYLRLLEQTGIGPELGLIALTAVVAAPLMEELLFRVVLQTWLNEFLPGRTAIVSTALLFAVIHGFPDSLAIFILALVLGVTYQRRRSYLAVVVVHALFNGYNVLATLILHS